MINVRPRQKVHGLTRLILSIVNYGYKQKCIIQWIDKYAPMDQFAPFNLLRYPFCIITQQYPLPVFDIHPLLGVVRSNQKLKSTIPLLLFLDFKAHHNTVSSVILLIQNNILTALHRYWLHLYAKYRIIISTVLLITLDLWCVVIKWSQVTIWHIMWV